MEDVPRYFGLLVELKTKKRHIPRNSSSYWQSFEKARPVDGIAVVGGTARNRGSGNVGASGGAAVAVALAAAVAAGKNGAMEAAAAAAEADATSEVQNVVALAAAAAGEDVVLARREVEGDGENVSIGEGARAIQGGIRGQQGGVGGEGGGIPIPAVDQTDKTPSDLLRSSNNSRLPFQ